MENLCRYTCMLQDCITHHFICFLFPSFHTILTCFVISAKIHSSPKETQLFWSCFSFGEECSLVNFGPNIISTILLITICQKKPFPWCTWPEVTTLGPVAPKKIWKLKLRFFWGRVYNVFHCIHSTDYLNYKLKTQLQAKQRQNTFT